MNIAFTFLNRDTNRSETLAQVGNFNAPCVNLGLCLLDLTVQRDVALKIVFGFRSLESSFRSDKILASAGAEFD